MDGISLLNTNAMGLVYALVLCYLFLGVAIVSDIFML